MSKVVELLSFLPKGGTAKRDLDERVVELALSVKDFNAKGDGNTDDTAAIQACFDVAFGPWATPHGGPGSGNPYINKPVYFPAGWYKVKPTLAQKSVISVTAGASNGAGGNYPRITVASTSGLVQNDAVHIRGTTGYNIDGSWGIQDITATTFEIKTIAFNPALTYTGGGVLRTPALRIRSLAGGKIFGAGRLSSILEMIDPDGQNAPLLLANGMGFSKVENLGFGCPTGCVAFDLMGDSTVFSAQSNTFQDCNFGGTGSTHCEIGLAIGHGYAAQGSENAVLNCYFGGATMAGLYVTNQNALQNSVMGGNFGVCRRGIYVNGGSCPNIQGVGFQNYQITPHVDIEVANGSASDCYYISGCRSESDNFLINPGGAVFNFNVSACSLVGANSGIFCTGAGNVNISNCYSLNGILDGNAASYIIENCSFQRTDYLTAGTSKNFRFVEVTPQTTQTITSTTYTFLSQDAGFKTIFTNASPVTVTLPRNSTNNIGLWIGSKLRVQQGGAGKVTFAPASGNTIRSRGGLLSLNGQWAAATLTCDAPDTWTLEGDIVA